MGKVLICYSPNDKVFVERLYGDLKQADINVEYLVEVPTDQSQLILLGSNVKETDVFLFVITKNMQAVIHQIPQVVWKYSVEKHHIDIINDNVTHNSGVSQVGHPERNLDYPSVTFFNTSYERALAKLLGLLPSSVRKQQYLFVSYANRDGNFVPKLNGFLKERGLSIWDYQSSERDYQSLLPVELERHVREASAVICLLSPDWKLSEWCRKEHYFASSIRKPIICLMIREMSETLGITSAPYISEFMNDEHVGFTKLEQALKELGLF